MYDHVVYLQITEASAGGMLMKMGLLSSLFPLFIKLLWFML